MNFVTGDPSTHTVEGKATSETFAVQVFFRGLVGDNLTWSVLNKLREHKPIEFTVFQGVMLGDTWIPSGEGTLQLKFMVNPGEAKSEIEAITEKLRVIPDDLASGDRDQYTKIQYRVRKPDGKAWSKWYEPWGRDYHKKAA